MGKHNGTRNGWVVRERKDSRTGTTRPCKVLYQNGKEISRIWLDGVNLQPVSDHASDIPSNVQHTDHDAKRKFEQRYSQYEEAKTEYHRTGELLSNHPSEQHKRDYKNAKSQYLEIGKELGSL